MILILLVIQFILLVIGWAAVHRRWFKEEYILSISVPLLGLLVGLITATLQWVGQDDSFRTPPILWEGIANIVLLTASIGLIGTIWKRKEV